MPPLEFDPLLVLLVVVVAAGAVLFWRILRLAVVPGPPSTATRLFRCPILGRSVTAEFKKGPDGALADVNWCTAFRPAVDIMCGKQCLSRRASDQGGDPPRWNGETRCAVNDRGSGAINASEVLDRLDGKILEWTTAYDRLARLEVDDRAPSVQALRGQVLTYIGLRRDGYVALAAGYQQSDGAKLDEFKALRVSADGELENVVRAMGAIRERLTAAA